MKKSCGTAVMTIRKTKSAKRPKENTVLLAMPRSACMYPRAYIYFEIRQEKRKDMTLSIKLLLSR